MLIHGHGGRNQTMWVIPATHGDSQLFANMEMMSLALATGFDGGNDYCY
jgi:hypothetical protein